MMIEMESIEIPQMEADEELTIPGDLTEWVAPEQLVDWVAETLEGLNWNNPELIDAMNRHPGFEPRALLSVLTFAYLTGTYGSEDVVRLCSESRLLRRIRPQLPPLVEHISSFRKLNRGLLHLVLVQVLFQALRTQFVEGDSITVFPPGIRRAVVQNAFERVNIARHMDRTAQA